MKKVYKANNGKKKISALAICLLLVAVLAIGGTIAYLFTSTDPVTNTFTVPETGVDIEEKFDGTVKKNVAVTNNSDFPAYVRMAVIISWEYNGIHHSDIPVEGTDYSITWNLGDDSKWFRADDGFYYYKEPVPAGITTDYIIEEIVAHKLGPVDNKETADATDDEQYMLAADILVQLIQAEPTDAVVDAWGVVLDSNDHITSVTLRSEELMFN